MTGLVKNARNTSPALWQGKGITSSAAAASAITDLAVVLNDTGNGTPILATLDGQGVGVNDILVKYTYNGDCDLNGKVDAADYFLIDSAFLGQGVVLSASAAAVTVPEPTTLGAMALGAMALGALVLGLRRRRR